MMLELKNGSVWQLVGTDNKDRLMGTNPVGVVLSEYSLQDPEAWEYIRPILSENGGWAVFLYTPRGRNHAYDLHQLVKGNDEWFTSVLTVEDTGAVSQESIDSERKAGMEEELVQQEYYVSYTSPRFGAFYGKQMEEARKGKRIGRVPFDPALATHTFWDLGISDYMTIWFVQLAGQEVHVVDYYEMDGEGLEHYVRVLEEKAKENNLIYGEHWAPHDIEARELGSGKSRRDTARDMGLTFNVVRMSAYKRQGGPLFVTEGIEAVRKILHRCWFDEERCAMGIKRLEQYRREWDNKMNCFRSSPLHDENCLTGDTKVLTRYGIHPIMNLPNIGEVHTSCGWKPYHSPRITRRNAPLVEVVFRDGLTVRCTPDHPFLTESGWRYAKLLTAGTLIQSSLTQSPNILMAGCTDFTQKKNTLQGVVASCIGMFGSLLLEISQKVITFITGITTQPTICFGTLSVCTNQTIYQRLGKKPTETKKTILQMLQERKQQNGTGQKPVECGTRFMLNDQKAGSSGSVNPRSVCFAVKSLWRWFVRLMPKNIARRTADTLIIESVKELDIREDVWCLSVPDGNAFSLSNGAIVHNSHGADGFRTLAMALKLGAGTKNKLRDENKRDRYERKLRAASSSPWAA